MGFPCARGCGACCRLLIASPELWNDVAKPGPDGACIQLRPDYTCAVFETRPDGCRIDKNGPPGMSKEEWYRRNREACHFLYGFLNGGDPLPPLEDSDD